MRISTLSLEHFRSYQRLQIPFGEPLCQIFLGSNGAGKTNLVEALSFLSTGRSCLKALPDDVSAWGQDFFRVRADVTSDTGEVSTIEYVWQRSPRRQSAMFLRDVRVPLLQFIGALPTIIFLPQHLDLFTGSPSHRRSFLDALLSQLGSGFAAMRLEYEKVLKQRNALLDRIGDGLTGESDLDLWDQRLSASAALLVQEREKVLQLLQDGLPERVMSLGEADWKDICLVHDRKTLSSDAAVIEQELIVLLREHRPRDLLLRTTSVGPHRDDWHIAALGHNIATFASRGQQRAALIALLLQSAALFESFRSERPVILLDDVFSELDDAHQSALLSSLKDHQVLITGTHPVPIRGSVKMWTVSDGGVIAV